MQRTAILCMLPCWERIGSFKYLGFEFWKEKFFPPTPLLGGGGGGEREILFARMILKRDKRLRTALNDDMYQVQ